MARILPGQIRTWTGGKLFISPANEGNPEHFYRGISTDTRTIRKGEIFLALKGENFDGHHFANQAIERGAACLVLQEDSSVTQKLLANFSTRSTTDILLVDDTLVAYGNIACGFRKTLLASVIAITGSVGKTTTRRMVSEVVSDQVNTHETRDNQNNLIGVPLTLLQASDDDDVIVAELGVDHPGEIGKLSHISQPDIAILTQIGYSHAAFLGSRENILKEKTDIIAGMKSNGLVIINGQDDLLSRWAQKLEGELSVWTVSNRPLDAEEQKGLPGFWAEDIHLTAQQTSFTAHNSLDPDTVLTVTIPTPGKHVVRAALFALASAYALGLDMSRAAQACGHFKNTGNRQQLDQLSSCLVVDDSYNASPESMLSALETIELLANGQQRTIACLAGVRELGPYAEELHVKIGRCIAEHPVDYLFLVGEESAWIQAGLEQAGGHIPTRTYTSAEALLPDLKALLQEHPESDIVLLKGSRFYGMEKIHHALQEEEASLS